MVKVYIARGLEESTTTGTGNFTTTGAITGYQTLLAGVGSGNTTDYTIEAVDSAGVPTGQWESGEGTVTAGTLVRDTVYDNSLGDTTKIDFNAGTKQIFGDLAAANVVQEAADVNIPVLNGPTYTTVEEALSLNHSAGWISGGGITIGTPTSTVDVGAGTGFIRATDSHVAQLLAFDWPLADNLVLTDLSLNYIYVEYNSGSPQIIATTTERSDHNTNVLLGTVFRNGTVLPITEEQRNTIVDHTGHMNHRLKDTMPFARVKGGVTTEVAGNNRNIAISAGVWWEGLTEFTTSAVDTSGAGRFSYFYDNNTGGFTEVTLQTVIDNTQYDDGSGGLATLSMNKHGVHWVYIGVDSHILVVYGTTNGTLGEAESAIAPSNVPAFFVPHVRLIAKIIILKSAVSFAGLTTAFETSLTGSTGIANVVDDASPQLGGDLDVNGFSLGDGTNILLDFIEDASAVNYIVIENEEAGAGPIIRADGSDTDIELALESKGSESVRAYNNLSCAPRTGSATRYITCVSHDDPGSFATYRYNGTVESPTAILNGDIIGEYVFAGADTASTTEWMAAVFNVVATEDWDAAGQGNEMNFYVTANDAGSQTLRFKIEQDGTLNVAGTTDYETLVTADDDIPNKKYVDDNAGMSNPMTTADDIIVGGASGVPTRLGGGSDDDVLTMVAGVPAWAAGGGGGPDGYIFSVAPTTPPIATNATATTPSLVIGHNATAGSLPDAIIIGNGAWTENNKAISIGVTAKAGAQGISLGFSSLADGTDCIAIGNNPTAQNFRAMAIGKNASATGEDSIAIGFGSIATTRNEISIGEDANADTSGGLQIALNGAATTFDMTSIGQVSLTGSDAQYVLPSYNVAGAPTALSAGAMAYFTDGDAGAACVGVYNGTNWKVVSLGATISAT